jgi:hypothetical protein
MFASLTGLGMIKLEWKRISKIEGTTAVKDSSVQQVSASSTQQNSRDIFHYLLLLFY